MRKTIQFLEKIYSQQCESGDYIMLAVKGKDIWKNIPIVFNKQFQKSLRDFFEKYPTEDFDLYWSPMPYENPRRKINSSLDTKFLAQDIDEFDDPTRIEPKPSYIWESSPNKYQGLWELDRYIEEPEYTPLNKALAKHLGCDDCFDFTHVYRIPGTINHKYRNHPIVKFPKATKVLYKPKKLRKLLGVGNTPVGGKNSSKDHSAPSQGENLKERKIYAKYPIPQKVKNLLALESLEGVDRSSTIWYVENKLHELGVSPNEIILLIKNSIFNKYQGRSDEETRLRRELEKIISGDLSQNEKDSSSLEVSTFGDVMGNGRTFEGWLVKGFWGRRSHGIVAGMPKCFKSTLVHDLVISVASGKPFLGKFPVLDPGPVLVVQNENADYIMRDRTEKVITNRGLVGRVRSKGRKQLRVKFPPDLPIHFINQQGFTLTNPDHRSIIENLLGEIKPVLVVFDPLYLMFDGDLNSAKDLNPILNWLLKLKTQYKTSVMVIHHYNKGGQASGYTHGGARMAGSIMLYGWVESAWYITKEEEDEETINVNPVTEVEKASGESTISLSREFRMSGSFPDVDIHIEMGEIGDPQYEVDVTAAGASRASRENLENEIIRLLENSNAPVTKRALLEQLGIEASLLRKTLEKLINLKRIVPVKGGYTISK